MNFNIIYTKKQTPDVFKTGDNAQGGVSGTSSVYTDSIAGKANVAKEMLEEQAKIRQKRKKE